MPTIEATRECVGDPVQGCQEAGRTYGSDTAVATPLAGKTGGSDRHECRPRTSPAVRPGPVNAMTIDVEDYFQVEALSACFPREAWSRVACRVERNVDRLLALLDEAGVQATFFTLGWVALRFPALVRRIAESGHELASHGYTHSRADRQQPREFQEDVRASKRLLEDLTGCRVAGYRAPSFSIGLANLWAFELLEAEGYAYSSSVYPVRHDLYGIPNAPRFPFYPGNGMLLEIPLTTAVRFGVNVPSAGGGYFRLLPYRISRANVRRVNCRERRPCVFYCHPWEIDPDQPHQPGLSWRSRIRHYTNLAATERRLKRLLADFSWGRMADVFFPGTDQPIAPHVRLH